MSFASIGHRTTKTRTVEVAGQRVTIKSTNRTWKGNHAGFYVYINGERFFSNTLDRREAENSTLRQWVEKQAQATKP